MLSYFFEIYGLAALLLLSFFLLLQGK